MINHEQNKELIDEATDGPWEKRINPKGETPMVVECSPSCDRVTGNQDDALLGALADGDIKQ